MARCECGGTVRPPTCRKCHKAQSWPSEARAPRTEAEARKQAGRALGGTRRSQSMSTEARSHSARMAALVRWAKKAN